VKLKFFAFLAALSMSSSACASENIPAKEGGIVDHEAWTQQEADAITTKCGAPTQWLKAVNGELQFKPDADGGYDVSACILEALKASGKLKKIGIIGNEEIRDDESK
jgi:hypothetical protein